MARPPTPVGHHGTINVKDRSYVNKAGVTVKKFTAYTYFRMADGSLPQIERSGPSKTAAINNLRERLTVLANEAIGGEISGETRMTRVIDLWIDEIETERDLGGISPNSVRNFKSYVKNWVKPAIGQLQAREAERMPGSFNRLLKRCRKERSYAAAKTLRTVLNSICMFAIRNGAMTSNPMAATSRLVVGEQKEIRALSGEERADLHRKLVDLGQRKQFDKTGRRLGGRGRVWLKLPDIQTCMLTTGVRIGELLALAGDDVDPVHARVRVRHHLIRIDGEGIVRVRYRKGDNPGRGEVLDLRVPQWSVPTWRRLKLASGGGPLFPSNKGGWMDPSIVINRLQEAFKEVGYEGITSHVWRKTVTDVLNEAGLPTNMIADQLGNTVAVVERHYRTRFKPNAAAVAALEAVNYLPGDELDPQG
ncbi:site-specific integrase [Amycolatopsis sp. NPDC006131]|uniref:tyrosine-type recombinase/integrase n=1 Tax=Amycolatopsis sp. NPDC006131 TaxID=3156731 RepID=UPI0033A9542F